MNLVIENPKWNQMRFSAHIDGAQAGMKVDIRTKSGDAGTSLIAEPKEPGKDGMISLLVEDEDRMDTAAFIVVIDETGNPKAQILTTIGK